MNFTTPYNTSDFFFTQEQEYILFNTNLANTYFSMEVQIKSYSFYYNQLVPKTLKYKIPVFQNKAKFLLGEIIDRAMPRFNEIKLTSLFQYKATEVTLIIKEIDITTENTLSSNTVGPIKFISGYKPELSQNNCAFLDLYNLPERISEKGYFLLNMLLTVGTHPISILKNGVEVDNFSIEVTGINIASRFINAGNYNVIQGDILECIMKNNPLIKKTVFIWPQTFYSNYIVFENEYRIKTMLQCLGDYNLNNEFSAKNNKVINGSVEQLNKVHSKTDVMLTINTGFILKEQELTIESLYASKKAYLLTGSNTAIELIPNPKKMPKYDPNTALYSFDLEFIVNVPSNKPLKLDLDSEFEFIEIDDIAPSVPTNLAASNTTKTSTDLSWNASTDAVGVIGYDIYKDGIYIDTSPTTQFSVTGLTETTTYSFTVKAKDAAGNISSASNLLSVTTASSADVTPPSAPTNLVASDIAPSSVKISWNAATDNVAVVKYLVFRDGTQIAETTSLNYTATGLSSQTQYSFTVKAVDAANNISIASTPVTATTTGGKIVGMKDVNTSSTTSSGQIIVTEPSTVYLFTFGGINLGSSATGSLTITGIGSVSNYKTAYNQGSVTIDITTPGTYNFSLSLNFAGGSNSQYASISVNP